MDNQHTISIVNNNEKSILTNALNRVMQMYDEEIKYDNCLKLVEEKTALKRLIVSTIENMERENTGQE